MLQRQLQNVLTSTHALLYANPLSHSKRIALTGATDALESESSGSLLKRQLSARWRSKDVLKQMCLQPSEEYGHTIS